VIAGAVDVAQSTFSKFCDHVIQAMLVALPVPSWPTQSERLRINCEFSEMTGGNAVGWAGLYISCFFFLCCSYMAGAGDLYMLAGREHRLTDCSLAYSLLVLLGVDVALWMAATPRFSPLTGSTKRSIQTRTQKFPSSSWPSATPTAFATLLVACHGHRATRWSFEPDLGTRRCSRRT